MSDPTMRRTLQNIPFFQDLPEEDLEKFAAMSRFVEFPANAVMFRELQPARDVFVILQGRVSLVIFEPGLGGRELNQVGVGDLIGWSTMLGRSQLSDTARTLEPVKAIAIDGERLRSLCNEDPRFGFKSMHLLARALSQRLDAMRALLVQKCGSQLPELPLESD